jgi:DNA-binding NarL/FixJ family response regulator
VDAIAVLTQGDAGQSPKAAATEAAATVPPQDDPLAVQVHRDTDGNPLFVQELVRLLAAEGRLGGNAVRGTGSAESGPIPQTVRDVIGRRLDRLSPACQQVLATAAVIGREFGEDVLATAAAVHGEVLLAALEEAETAHIIQAVPGVLDRYRFAHALIRETLYEDIATARRARLHLRVAAAIEQTGDGDDPARLAALAGHYRLAGVAAPAGKAIEYAHRAGAAEAAVFAWEEAAAHWQAALDLLQRRGDADEPAVAAQRCDLLLALSDALMPAGAPRRVAEEVAPQAFALAEVLADDRRASEACQNALSALFRYGDTLSFTTAAFRRWAERADRYAAPDTRERVPADVVLGYLRSATGRAAEGRELRRRALALARALGHAGTRLVAALHIVAWPDAPGYHAERLRLVREGAAWPRAGVTPTPLGDFLYHAGCLLLDWGERAEAETLWREEEDLAARTHDAFLLLHPIRKDILLALLDGRLHDAVTGGGRLIALAEQLGAPVRGRNAALGATLRPLLHLGRAEEALAAHVEFYQAGEFYQIGDGEAARLRGDHALLLAHAGQTAEARDILREALRRVVSEGEDVTPVHTLTWLLETAVLVEDREAAALLADRLAPLAGLATADLALTCLGRHLGAAAALAGHAETAARHYEQALTAALKVRFRPEAALTRLQYAELLAGQSGRAAEAHRQLEPALAALEAMQMAPALTRARSLAARLGPAGGPVAPAATSAAPPYPGGLTAREVEVLRLIAAGLTDKEIAAELVLSPATVRRHAVNLYAKIGARGRADATAYAFRHGLVGSTAP